MAPRTVFQRRLGPLAGRAAALEDLQGTPISIPRHAELIVEGQPYGRSLILVDGGAARYRLLPDGRRQILAFVVPGDIIGLRGWLFEAACSSVIALEPLVVRSLDPEQIYRLLRQRPALAAAFSWSTAIEQTLLSERLVAVGRRSAYERLAYLFLELLVRPGLVGRAGPCSYRFPLSQDVLADALGLSAVHVNRTLGRLRRDRLVTVSEQEVVMHDVAALSKLADFDGGCVARYRPSAFAQSAFELP